MDMNLYRRRCADEHSPSAQIGNPDRVDNGDHQLEEENEEEDHEVE
jgi:hypothetical protein